MPDRIWDEDEAAFLLALCTHRSAWDGRTVTDDEMSALLDGSLDPLRAQRIVESLLSDREGRIRLAERAAPSPSFVGRSAELAALRESIGSGARWTTVTGRGGVGKSRLVREAATAFPSVWITCSHCETPGDLARSVARALGWTSVPGPEELPERCEQAGKVFVFDDLPPAFRWTEALSALCGPERSTQVIVTSRKRRGVSGETVLKVAPLGSRVGTEAFRNLVEAWRGVGRTLSFPTASESSALCRRLAGLPLALGMAAGCLADQTPDQILDALDSVRNDHVSRGAATSPLDEMLVLALESLGKEDRAALFAITAFAGDFDVEDFSIVASSRPDTLRSLVLKGLVAPDPSFRTGRYRLHDSIKDALAGRGIDDAVTLAHARKRHAAHFAERASQVGNLMSAGDWQHGWETLHDSNAEFRRATAWAVQTQDHELTRRLSDGLSRSYFEAGYLTDFDRLARATDRSSRRHGDDSLRVRLLGLMGALASRSGDEERCTKLWNERLRLSRITGDAFAETDTLTDLAWQAFEHGDLDRALSVLDEARLAGRRAGVVELVATAEVIEAKVMEEAGRTDEARAAADRTEQLLHDCHDRDLTLFVYQTLVRVLAGLGESDRSLTHLTTLLKESWEGRRAVMTGWALRHLAPVFEAKGDARTTAECLVASVAVHNQYATKHKALAEDALRAFVERAGPQGQDLVAAARARAWERVIDEILERSSSP
ncbi:MAG: hypothetical protein JST30_16895 [Armatimonadetes bacterium]|nr:hypothetical protein [Armatimonadota bacterium]